MTSYLHESNGRILNHPLFAVPFRDRLRKSAARLAAEAGIKIGVVRKQNSRKEKGVRKILARHESIRGWCA
jgi:hypothetical protein